MPDGRWQLLTELRYLSETTQKSYTILPGFVTDFASVPRLPIAFWLTGNTAHAAAIIHDYLYQNGEEPREVCDAIFYEITSKRIEGMPAWRAKLMALGVRLFGGKFYTPPRP